MLKTSFPELAIQVCKFINLLPFIQSIKYPDGLKIYLQVLNVDAYQGRENAIIIVSFTRSNSEKNVGFTRSPNRLNVAISRA